jgi:Ran GTPase-activating protein (RanGAP) involved in mRNA processing and transport
MKVLTHLDMGFNEVGDQGIAEVVRALKEYSVLEYLDISGNFIGKSGSSHS